MNNQNIASQLTNNTVNISFPPKDGRRSYLSKEQAGSFRTNLLEESLEEISRGMLALKKSHSSSSMSRSTHSTMSMSQRGITFANEVEIYEITPLQRAHIDDMFYSQDALADMRYEAFMEKCGLDPAEFE
jgi:hypothetical protein